MHRNQRCACVSLLVGGSPHHVSHRFATRCREAWPVGSIARYEDRRVWFALAVFAVSTEARVGRASEISLGAWNTAAPLLRSTSGNPLPVLLRTIHVVAVALAFVANARVAGTDTQGEGYRRRHANMGGDVVTDARRFFNREVGCRRAKLSVTVAP